MPSPQPVAFAGTLQLAADQSLPQDPIPFNFSGQYTALAEFMLNLVSGSTTVPFGSVAAPGAKGVLIRYDAQPSPAGAAQVTINAGSEPLELTPGGFLAYFNPTPAAGITAMTIAVTTACQLKVWLLG